ncbi:YkgJ family cysteine cluster protein [Aquimarina sp. 2201CG14-23]|uniref:YkgJ family cysteine cluster protein n=1 Tax=Aquimarina mycalae TaxID=3040073 RepID=UPI002477E57C|nr:YkgJ family cysteine cluster protein [Aquimarina sp. 2201CG14-23]MDH7444935.1 YkgJ family cysteine cluster protein [Aquimarina sp. 2201CG14-23]
MQEFIDQLPKLAKDKQNENKKYFVKLKKKPPKNLDTFMQDLHKKEFQNTDCLECANCCKTTGPLFTDIDVDRISKHLKMKSIQFEDQYLKKDEDGDFVLKETPCAFLAADNYCLIYDVRPKACKEFPHTDRKKFHQISSLTMQNVTVCPAAYNIVEKMKELMPLEHKSNRRA